MGASTEETERVRAYFRSWTARDGASVATLLDPGFRFTAGDMTIEGRDAFLGAGAFPTDAVTTMLDEAYQGEVAFQLYRSTRDERSVVIAERLLVRDGRIVASLFVADMAAFGAFMAPTAHPEGDA